VVVPTVVLSIVSLVHPIFSVRYVAASAPGAALLAAFPIGTSYRRFSSC
jgi:hypothetical protein